MELKRFVALQRRRLQKFTMSQAARPAMLANLTRNLYECQRQATVLGTRPWNVLVELTANCNLACPMCRTGFEKYDPGKDMPWELFERIATQLFPTALMVDLRSQGESTIARDWERVLDFIEPFKARFAIVTNGMALNERMIERLAKKQVGVTVSFDGATAETFESIRLGGKFTTVCRNVANLAAAQRRHGNPLRNLSLRTTAQRDNLDELPAIVQLAYELGVRVIHIHAINLMDERGLERQPEKARRQLEAAQERGRQLGFLEVEIPPLDLLCPSEPRDNAPSAPPPNDAPDTFCNEPWKTINIGYDGKVFACCYGHMPYMGNLLEEDFDAIWNGPRYRKLRETVNSAKPWPRCATCYAKHRYLNASFTEATASSG